MNSTSAPGHRRVPKRIPKCIHPQNPTRPVYPSLATGKAGRIKMLLFLETCSQARVFEDLSENSWSVSHRGKPENVFSMNKNTVHAQAGWRAGLHDGLRADWTGWAALAEVVGWLFWLELEVGLGLLGGGNFWFRPLPLLQFVLLLSLLQHGSSG